MINISDILSPKHILLDLEADTQTKAIAKVAELLEHDSRVKDWNRFYEGVVANCSCTTNESGSGICIAHVRTNAVSGMIMAVGRSLEGVPFDEAGIRVRLLFVIGVPVALASDYLRIIGALARIFRAEKGEAALLTAKTHAKFLERLCALEIEM